MLVIGYSVLSSFCNYLLVLYLISVTHHGMGHTYAVLLALSLFNSPHCLSSSREQYFPTGSLGKYNLRVYYGRYLINCSKWWRNEKHQRLLHWCIKLVFWATLEMTIVLPGIVCGLLRTCLALFSILPWSRFSEFGRLLSSKKNCLLFNFYLLGDRPGLESLALVDRRDFSLKTSKPWKTRTY